MSASGTPHFLSVEDHPDTRLLLKHLLDENYELSFATSAEEALGILKTDNWVDLLLVDINLGSDASGTDLLREIENLEEIQAVPAIALTAYAMPGDREKLLSKGFDGYVGKPFTYEELAGAIGQVLSAERGA